MRALLSDSVTHNGHTHVQVSTWLAQPLALPSHLFSAAGQSSWSYKTDMALGQSVIDRFTLLTLQFAERLSIDSSATLQHLFDTYE